MEINNIDDVFLTTSKDQSLKLWSLESMDDQPEAILDFSSKKTSAVANFDPSGLVMAVAYAEERNASISSYIRLYDMKRYEEVNFFYLFILFFFFCLFKFIFYKFGLYFTWIWIKMHCILNLYCLFIFKLTFFL
jgi:WD40 repeat protein